MRWRPPMPDRISRALYQGRDRAPARAFLHAIGLKTEDIDKPFVGVSNVWTETMPCNFGLRELAVPVKAGVRAAGANPMEFNSIAISDGITMGTEGMKAPLVSREVIADSIELRSEEHTSELQSPCNLVCRLLLEKKNNDQEHCAAAIRADRQRVDPAGERRDLLIAHCLDAVPRLGGIDPKRLELAVHLRAAQHVEDRGAICAVGRRHELFGADHSCVRHLERRPSHQRD